jgi:Fic-DOC domain mobile mystery protein B
MARRLFPFEYAPGATPLDPNEIEGLRADYICTQSELNQLEQENILEAKVWASGKRHKNLLTDTFVRDLHKRMFKNVWKWAGKTRLSDKSIGVPWQQVPTECNKLLADTVFWINNAIYSWDELGARFHHRLVVIHPFSNGNGRHARLMTDLLLEAHGQQMFTWGSRHSDPVRLETAGDARDEYIASLREADARRINRLVRFVRS